MGTGTSSDRARQPQVDAVPLIFHLLDLEAADAATIAATYQVPDEAVARALAAAECEGWLLDGDGVYELTAAGTRAAATRGGGRPAPVGRYLSRNALLETPEQFGHRGE